jgi:hypothetical protein
LFGLTKKQLVFIALLLVVAVSPRLFFNPSPRSTIPSPVATPQSSLNLMQDADAALQRMEEMLVEPERPNIDDILQAASFPDQIPSGVVVTTTTSTTTTSTLTPSPQLSAEPVTESSSVENVGLIKAYEEKLKLLEERNTILTRKLEDQRVQNERDKATISESSGEAARVRQSLQQQLQQSLKEKDDQIKENEKLKRRVDDFEKRIKLIEEQRLADSAEKDRVLMKQVSDLRQELATAKSATDELKKTSRVVETERDAAKSRADHLLRELEAKQKSLDELNLRLADAEKTVEESKGLKQDLALARSELLLAKEQVQAMLNTPVRRQSPVSPRMTPSPAGGDVVTVEVVVPKAVLRTGPGEEHSSLMEIQRGSVLVVEAREGDWLRVVSPKGQRAFIRSDLTVELDAAGRPRFSAPTPTKPPVVRQQPLAEILGQKPAPPPGAKSPEDEENEAFEALRKGMSREQVPQSP